MKELIALVVFIVSIYSGTAALKAFHETVKRAALKKAAHGLPSLTEMNRAVTRPKR